MDDEKAIVERLSPLEMNPDEFRALGYQLIDRIASFLDSLPGRPVTPAESPSTVRRALGAERQLPRQGTDAELLLSQAADLLFDHSLFNGHPGATSPRPQRPSAFSANCSPPP
jgi:aromatic-L-amino-acid decarboxylase